MLSIRVAPLRSVLPVCLGLLAGPVCLAKTAPPPPPVYCVTDLGSLNEETTRGYDLTNSGEVVGASWVGTGINHAFHWADGVIQDLGTPAPGSSISANRINEYGWIVGTGLDANGVSQAYYTFPFPGATWRKIFHPGDSAQGWGVNDYAWMVGTYFVNSEPEAESHPFVFTPHIGFYDLGEISGSGQGEAFTINNAQQAGGTSTSLVGDCGVPGHDTPVIWQGGDLGQWTVTVLPTAGRCDAAVMAISENNVAVGFTQSLFPSPVVWRKGHSWIIQFLETGGGLGLGGAMDVNESGWIVGFTNGATLWTNTGQRYDLNTLIETEGWDLASASAINDQGQIVGTGYHNGEIRAFLLTPKPPMTDCP